MKLSLFLALPLILSSIGGFFSKSNIETSNIVDDLKRE